MPTIDANGALHDDLGRYDRKPRSGAAAAPALGTSEPECALDAGELRAAADAAAIAAEWTNEGAALDDESRAWLRDEIEDYATAYPEVIEEMRRRGYDVGGQLGHDFVLGMQGEGAGMWDRDELREGGFGSAANDLLTDRLSDLSPLSNEDSEPGTAGYPIPDSAAAAEARDLLEHCDDSATPRAALGRRYRDLDFAGQAAARRKAGEPLFRAEGDEKAGLYATGRPDQPWADIAAQPDGSAKVVAYADRDRTEQIGEWTFPDSAPAGRTDRFGWNRIAE